MALVVRPSPIHSVGVYTSTPIRKGTRVVEYAGERITPKKPIAATMEFRAHISTDWTTVRPSLTGTVWALT